MVATFLELGLVVDHGGRVGALDLHLAGGEVALEVAGIVERIPQAPFHGAGHLKRNGRVAVVGQVQTIDLGGGMQRHEGGECAGHADALGLEHGVADAVAATVDVQRGLGGQERGRPSLGGCAVLVHAGDVVVAGAVVAGHVVVAIAGDAAQFGVLVEAVAAAGVRDQGEEVFVAQVVDPWQRGGRGLDHVLAGCIIEVSVSHGSSLASGMAQAASPVSGVVPAVRSTATVGMATSVSRCL